MKTRIYQRFSVLAVSVLAFSGALVFMAQDLPKTSNAVANPGFEEGVKKWDMEALLDKNSGLCDSVFHQGNYSVLIKCKGEGKFQHISQALSLPLADSKVDCSVWVKTSKPEFEYQVYFDITAKKEGGAPEWASGPSSGIQKNPDSEWKEVKFNFTFPGDQNDKDGNIKKMSGFYFRLATKDKYAGDIWFDDASVVVTPPSETVAPAK